MAELVTWHYRLDGRGEWVEIRRRGFLHAEDVAADVAEDTEDTDGPNTLEVEVRSPTGVVTRWRVEPEVSVEWNAYEASGPFAADFCVCGCPASAHASTRRVGYCAVCERGAKALGTPRCEAFRRAPGQP